MQSPGVRSELSSSLSSYENVRIVLCYWFEFLSHLSHVFLSILNYNRSMDFPKIQSGLSVPLNSLPSLGNFLRCLQLHPSLPFWPLLKSHLAPTSYLNTGPHLPICQAAFLWSIRPSIQRWHQHRTCLPLQIIPGLALCLVWWHEHSKPLSLENAESPLLSSSSVPPTFNQGQQSF